MITITTQGKTYQIVDLKGRIKSTIEEWISAWYLEEVKENKEQWTPTIWKELQVSLDWKEWTTWILERYDFVDYEYPFRVGGGYWKYARKPQEDIELLPKWLQKVKNVYYWITEGGYWTGLVLEMEDGTFLRHQSTDIIRAFEFFNPQK